MMNVALASVALAPEEARPNPEVRGIRVVVDGA
jgi:hypothetical protein